MSVHKRKTFFIDFAVQGALIRRALLHWCVFASTVFVLVYCMHVMTADPDVPWASHLSAIWARYKIIVFVLLSLLPAMMLDLVRWSHRFAGPMIRVRRMMRSLANGETVNPLHLRDGDYWTDLADDFNTVVQRIQRAETDESEGQPDAGSTAGQTDQSTALTAVSQAGAPVSTVE